MVNTERNGGKGRGEVIWGRGEEQEEAGLKSEAPEGPGMWGH